MKAIQSAQLLYNYAIALGGIQAQLDKPDLAIQAYEKAIQVSPDAPERWRVEAALAQMYARMGNCPRRWNMRERPVAGARRPETGARSTDPAVGRPTLS